MVVDNRITEISRYGLCIRIDHLEEGIHIFACHAPSVQVPVPTDPEALEVDSELSRIQHVEGKPIWESHDHPSLEPISIAGLEDPHNGYKPYSSRTPSLAGPEAPFAEPSCTYDPQPRLA